MPPCDGQFTHKLPERAVRMSDIQQYLLDYDRNKTEATLTAQRSATRMLEALAGA